MTPDELLTIAKDLISLAGERDVILRVFGSLAIRARGPQAAELLDRLGREPTRDVDFMAYSAQTSEIQRMFRDLDYQPDPAVAYSQEYGIQRLIYYRRPDRLMVEVFLDELRMAHTIGFRGRLELDPLTLTPVDLLLTKLQIQRITEKDLKDLIALLATHELGDGGDGRVEVPRLLALTSDRWGFYYTARGNLERVMAWAEDLQALRGEEREAVLSRARALLQRMEAAPKSLRWKARAKIGTRLRWYEEVGEVHR